MRRQGKISIVGTALVAVAALASTLVGTAPADAANPPSTSPSVSRAYYSDLKNPPKCASGYACAAVLYGSGLYVFRFYKYGTYYLSDWLDEGSLRNAQTGGAAFRLYNSSGKQTACVPPSQVWDDVYWTPAWKIKLTSSGC